MNRVMNDYPSNQEHGKRVKEMLQAIRGNRESEGDDDERDELSGNGDGGNKQPVRENVHPRK